MNARAVLTRLLRTEWEVWVENEQLMVRHATLTLTTPQREFLTRHKTELLAVLETFLDDAEQAGLAADASRAQPLPVQTATGACVHLWVVGCLDHAGLLQCARCAQVYMPVP